MESLAKRGWVSNFRGNGRGVFQKGFIGNKNLDNKNNNRSAKENRGEKSKDNKNQKGEI